MLDSSIFDLHISHPGRAGGQCSGCVTVHLSGRKCWPPQCERSFAPSSCPSCMIQIHQYLLWTLFILAGHPIGFSHLHCGFVKSLLHQLQTMGTQMIKDDGWELIADDTCPIFVQPTAKAMPLPRPQHAVQQRFPALRSVHDIPSTGGSNSIRAGPQLTVAGLSGAAPQQVPVFAPVRRHLVHHVSHVASPYARVLREDYHPRSLERFSPDDTACVSPLAPAHPEGTALCPSTANALPCPPLKKEGIPKSSTTRVRTSKAIQLTRSKLTSGNPFLLDKFEQLLGIFGESSDVYKSLASSPYAAEHRKRLLNSYAATTVLRYLQAVQKFVIVAQRLDLDIHNWSEAQLADVLTVMQLSKSCDTDKDVPSGNFTIKALRWWHKVAGVQNLQICFSPLVDSFLKTKLSKDKREAPPLPLWILHLRL